ncbi:MAG: hypothetical protein Q8Q12_16720 [bacterium]|nr:hypothetical protein [bacterium]
MSPEDPGWSVEQVGPGDPTPLPINVQELLDDLNRQRLNRSWWRKVKDWWLYPKGHRKLDMDKRNLTLDQVLLLKIHQLQIHEAARAHQLSMVTWLLVVIALTTLVVVLIK